MVIKAGWLEEQQKEYACVAGGLYEAGVWNSEKGSDLARASVAQKGQLRGWKRVE